LKDAEELAVQAGWGVRPRKSIWRMNIKVKGLSVWLGVGGMVHEPNSFLGFTDPGVN
jgi:hypothetical protein